jgi:hypothetical protein
MLTRARKLVRGPRPACVAAVLLSVVIVLGETGFVARAKAVASPDIYFIWRDGIRLAQGENPYSYAHLPEPGESPTKHPSYLPLFYLAVAGMHELGVHEYQTWLHLWRAVRILAHVGIALLLYLGGQRAGCPLLGLFGAVFWSLNRWTLYTVRSGGLDELAVLFLLLSLQAFAKRRRLAFLLFGTSLAIKHVGILVAPLYLVWTRQLSPPGSRRDRWTAVGQATLWIALIPTAVSLPFIWWEAGAFVRSMLGPVTRPSESLAHVSAVGSLLGLRGSLAHIPMLLLWILLVLVAAHQRVIGRYMTILLVFTVFTDFHTVLFPQYFAWVTPFIVLAVVEHAARSPRPEAESDPRPSSQSRAAPASGLARSG